MEGEFPLDELRNLKTFAQLKRFLEKEMDWPFGNLEIEDLTFDYEPEELGIKPKLAARIKGIKRLRSLSVSQPWGIFFIEFEKKSIDIGVLRRILAHVALKKRSSNGEQGKWSADDLLFISNFGPSESRQISFAHFSQSENRHEKPVLRVLAWDESDANLHLRDVIRNLKNTLAWQGPDEPVEQWQERWKSAFVLRHGEVIQTSKQLSIALAKLARRIRDRIVTALDSESDKGPLTRIKSDFEATLLGSLTNSEFADMYAQTISYGLLSARLSNGAQDSVDGLVNGIKTSPFLRELMEVFLIAGGRRSESEVDFDELGIHEIVDLLSEAKLESVVMHFGDLRAEEDPVIHFYELFLQEYDNKVRIERGVYYTPRSIVGFIVRSIDEQLKSNFGLSDGLADVSTWAEVAVSNPSVQIPAGVNPSSDFVNILDPATGTGTFLVEIVEHIYITMRAKWGLEGKSESEISVSWKKYVEDKLLKRINGYELMMAPYSIAHLKLSLKLFETGYEFKGDERVNVFLTNAIDPAQVLGDRLEGILPALAHEATTVNKLKKDSYFTVVLGNPPYSIMSGNLSEKARRIVDPFRYVDGELIREKSAIVFERTIQDDYVKFFALARNVIAKSGCGVLGFISNNSYQDNINLRGMRCDLYDVFNHIELVDLHGAALQNKLGSSGERDENVFDIRTAVSIFIGTSKKSSANRTMQRIDLYGSRDEKNKLLKLSTASGIVKDEVQPRAPKYIFLATNRSIEDLYESGVSVESLFMYRASGIQTGKDDILIDFSKEELKKKLIDFANPSTSIREVIEKFDCESGYGEKLLAKRKSIEKDESFDQRIVPLMFTPFDSRVVFYRKDIVKVHSDEVSRQILSGTNLNLIVVRQVAGRSFSHVFVTRSLANQRSFYSTRGTTYQVPVMNIGKESLGTLFGGFETNFVIEQAKRLLPDELSADHENLFRLFCFIYAQMFSTEYRLIFKDELQRDYPHLFRSIDLSIFEKMSDVGRRLVDIHSGDESPVEVPSLDIVGSFSNAIERPQFVDGTIWLDGDETFGFTGVSSEVWNLEIGGYKICEKWLKDRNGRKLSKADRSNFLKILATLAETLRIQEHIDRTIESNGGWDKTFSKPIANSVV
jgi:hypothetical protein